MPAKKAPRKISEAQKNSPAAGERLSFPLACGRILLYNSTHEELYFQVNGLRARAYAAHSLLREAGDRPARAGVRLALARADALGDALSHAVAHAHGYAFSHAYGHTHALAYAFPHAPA